MGSYTHIEKANKTGKAPSLLSVSYLAYCVRIFNKSSILPLQQHRVDGAVI